MPSNVKEKNCKCWTILSKISIRKFHFNIFFLHFMLLSTFLLSFLQSSMLSNWKRRTIKLEFAWFPSTIFYIIRVWREEENWQLDAWLNRSNSRENIFFHSIFFFILSLEFVNFILKSIIETLHKLIMIFYFDNFCLSFGK